jgi:DNA polymerase/3'-5' exonuclease PolX
MDITNIQDKDRVYDIADNGDGSYTVKQQGTDKQYTASFLSCNCTGFRYNHDCKHRNWIIEHEKALHKGGYSYDFAIDAYTGLYGAVFKLLPDTSKWEMRHGGSLSRHCKIIGDIDVVIGVDNDEIIKTLNSNVHSILNYEVQLASDRLIRGVRNTLDAVDGTAIPVQFDIHICPKNSIESFNFYLTGNKHFTRNIRKLARKAGYTLTEHGLFQFDEVAKSCSIFVTNKEKEIFEKIGIPYVKPNNRNYTE